jgi:hypothetical protein
MFRFAIWTAAGMAIGLGVGIWISDPGYKGTVATTLSMAISYAAGTLAGTIGGAMHVVIAFLRDREAHRVLLENARRGRDR